MRTYPVAIFLVILVATQASLIERVLDGIKHKGSGEFKANSGNVTLGYNGSIYYNFRGHSVPILSLDMNFSASPETVQTKPEDMRLAVGYNGDLNFELISKKKAGLKLRGSAVGFNKIDSSDLKAITVNQGLSNNHTLNLETEDGAILTNTSTSYTSNGHISAAGMNASLNQNVSFDFLSDGKYFTAEKNNTLYNISKSSKATIQKKSFAEVLPSGLGLDALYNGNASFSDDTYVEFMGDSSATTRQGAADFNGKVRSQVSGSNISFAAVDKTNYAYDEQTSAKGGKTEVSSVKGTADTYTLMNMTNLSKNGSFTLVNGGKINHFKSFGKDRIGNAADYTAEWKAGTNTTMTTVGNSSSVETNNALFHRYAGNEGLFTNWDSNGTIGVNSTLRTNNNKIEENSFEFHKDPAFADFLAKIATPTI